MVSRFQRESPVVQNNVNNLYAVTQNVKHYQSIKISLHLDFYVRIKGLEHHSLKKKKPRSFLDSLGYCFFWLNRR